MQPSFGLGSVLLTRNRADDKLESSSIARPLCFSTTTIDLLPHRRLSSSLGTLLFPGGVVNGVLRCRERLLKPLVQEFDGPLPSHASSLGVILRAILLEKPMCGPRIRIAGDRPARSLDLLLHLRKRLRRIERVIFREVAEVRGLCTA